MSDETKHNEWVYQKLSALSSEPAPENPDAALERYRSYERRAKRHARIRRTIVAAAGIAALLVLALNLRKPEAVRADSTAIGSPAAFRLEPVAPVDARFVPDLAEAQQESGFEPWIPQTLVGQLTSGLAVLK
ncbi:MAG TPA: hypothetical protein VKY31_10925, partial [Terriglobia bacterium]|nr:hypothetical protein [Terriglobia bacterium]